MTIRNGRLAAVRFFLDERACFTPHTAFEDPGTPPQASPRRSIEMRAFAFFPD
jgi:hypothetical protein